MSETCPTLVGPALKKSGESVIQIPTVLNLVFFHQVRGEPDGADEPVVVGQTRQGTRRPTDALLRRNFNQIGTFGN